jgi:anti-sigma B factor antagonist
MSMSGLEGFESVPPDCLRMEREGETVFLRLSGEFDISCQEATDTTLAALPGKDGVTAIVIDMREVTFVDSLGLRVLLRHEVRSREGKFDLALIAPRGHARKVFDLSGVSQIIQIRPDPDAPSSDAAKAADRASAGLGTDNPDPADWLSRQKE